MQEPRIVVIAAVLLVFFFSVISSASFAQDRDQALVQAAGKGDLKRVQELLEKGVDINAKTRSGVTALRLLTAKAT